MNLEQEILSKEAASLIFELQECIGLSFCRLKNKKDGGQCGSYSRNPEGFFANFFTFHPFQYSTMSSLDSPHRERVELSLFKKSSSCNKPDKSDDGGLWVKSSFLHPNYFPNLVYPEDTYLIRYKHRILIFIRLIDVIFFDIFDIFIYACGFLNACVNFCL